jgi:hypothetical protein
MSLPVKGTHTGRGYKKKIMTDKNGKDILCEECSAK